MKRAARRFSCVARVAVVGLVGIALAARAGVRVVDDDGRVFERATPAARIVSLAPHLTELLFAAGAGDRVVGVSAWSDFPPAAQRLPQVGDSALLDLERIVALRPDVVVVWRGGASAQQLQRLAAARLPVYASDTRSLAHIAHTLRQFGRLAGTEAAAAARAEAFERQVQALRARHAHQRVLRVFYEIWPQPLMTVNGTHPISEALGVCGAVNVFAAQPLPTPTVDVEAVIAARPDAIVTSRLRPGSGTADPRRRWQALRSVTAAQVQVDPDKLHRPTDRMADGIAELCAALDRLR